MKRYFLEFYCLLRATTGGGEDQRRDGMIDWARGNPQQTQRSNNETPGDRLRWPNGNGQWRLWTRHAAATTPPERPPPTPRPMALPTPRPPQRQRPAARALPAAARHRTPQHDTDFLLLGRSSRFLAFRKAEPQALLPSPPESSESLPPAFEIEKLTAAQGKKEGCSAIGDGAARPNWTIQQALES